eukprot:UN13310
MSTSKKNCFNSLLVYLFGNISLMAFINSFSCISLSPFISTLLYACRIASSPVAPSVVRASKSSLTATACFFFSATFFLFVP